MTTTTTTTGAALAAARNGANISARALSHAAGIDPATLSRIEHGTAPLSPARYSTLVAALARLIEEQHTAA